MSDWTDSRWHGPGKSATLSLMKNYGASPVAFNSRLKNQTAAFAKLPAGGNVLSDGQKAAQAVAAVQRARDVAAQQKLAREIVKRAQADQKFRDAFIKETAGKKGNQVRALLDEVARTDSDRSLRRTAQNLGAGRDEMGRSVIGVRKFGDIKNVTTQADADSRLAAINNERQQLLAGTTILAGAAIGAAAAAQSLNGAQFETVKREDVIQYDTVQDSALDAKLNNIVSIDRTPLQSGVSVDDVATLEANKAQIASLGALGPIATGAALSKIANAQAQVQAAEVKVEEAVVVQEQRLEAANQPNESEQVVEDAVTLMAATLGPVVALEAGVEMAQTIGLQLIQTMAPQPTA